MATQRKAKRTRPPALALTCLCLAALPAFAADDFRDAPYLSAKITSLLEYERTGTEVTWQNPETGNSGTIRITKTFYLDPQTPCRDYIRTLERGSGEPRITEGSGCRESDGSWRLSENAPSPPARAKDRPGEPGSQAKIKAKAAAGEAPKQAEASEAASAPQSAARSKAPEAEAPPRPPKIRLQLPMPSDEWEATDTDGGL